MRRRPEVKNLASLKFRLTPVYCFGAEVEPDLECRSRLRQDSAFLSDANPDPESKICEKPVPESRFNFGSSRSLCGHFISKSMVKLRLDG